MKKTILTFISSAAVCAVIITAAALLTPQTALALCANSSSPGCSTSGPTGSGSSSTAKKCTVNGALGGDGHCHCNEGFEKVTQKSPEGYPHSCVAASGAGDAAAVCEDLKKIYADLQQEYKDESKKLTDAQAALTKYTNLYLEKYSKDPSSVKAIVAVSTDICTASSTNDAVGCGGPQGKIGETAISSQSATSSSGECKDLSAQCDQLDALVASTKQSACILNLQAMQFITATGSSTATSTPHITSISPSSGPVGTVVTITGTGFTSNNNVKFDIDAFRQIAATNGSTTLSFTVPANLNASCPFSNPGCTVTQSTKVITGTGGNFNVSVENANGLSNTVVYTVASSTGTNTITQDSAAFTLSLSPNVIAQGDTFTVNANINSTSVQTYSISALQNGQNLGNLLSNVSAGGSSRPVAISQSFKTSSSIPTGTYTIKISNDSNFNQFQTATLTVNAYTSSASSNLFSQNGNYSGSNNYSGTTGQNIIFLYPTSSSMQRINSTMPIHWGYNAYISGNIDLYLQTVCSNGVSSCTPSTALIASGIPVTSVYYNWALPPYIPLNSWGVILAKQGSTVVGYSSTFIVTQ